MQSDDTSPYAWQVNPNTGPPRIRILEFPLTFVTGDMALVPVPIVVLDGGQAPIAYRLEGEELRSFGGRVFSRWYSDDPQGEPHTATDLMLVKMIEKWVGNLRNLQPGDQKHKLREASQRMVVIDGKIWMECGEPAYNVHVYRGFRGAETTVGATVVLQHSPWMRITHDDLFAADRHDEAMGVLMEWHSRGIEFMNSESANLPEIEVTGAHQPGSTWKPSGLLSMPDPENMPIDELSQSLNELSLRLGLANAIADVHGTLDTYNSEYLTHAQEDVVLAYFGCALEVGLDPRTIVWVPETKRRSRR